MCVASLRTTEPAVVVGGRGATEPEYKVNSTSFWFFWSFGGHKTSSYLFILVKLVNETVALK